MTSFGIGTERIVVIALSILLVVSVGANIWTYTSLQGQIDSLNTQKNALQNQVNTLQSQVASLNATYLNYVSNHTHSNAEYDALSTAFNSLNTSFNTLLTSYNTLNTSYSSLNTTLQNYMATHSHNNTEFEALQRALENQTGLNQLMADLQRDTTDRNQFIANYYEDEHYGRDLEDNLEALGYNVTYVVVFEFNNSLGWTPLVRVVYGSNFAALVNARTDAVVTSSYDGNGDGVTATLSGLGVNGAVLELEKLVATSLGNDGKYLNLEFSDYETVKFVATAVAQPKTRADLAQDLELDGTSEEEYVNTTNDCDDFARKLEDNLEAKGYVVTIKIVYWKEDGVKKGHAIVDVYLADGVVTIEPQTDEDVTSTYDGDGDGTVETSSPGKIRSQAWIFGFCHGLPFCGGTDNGYLIFEYDDSSDIPFDVD